MPRFHGKPADSWWATTTPATQVSLSAMTWIGVQLKFTVTGRLFGFRYWAVSGFGTASAIRFWDVTDNKYVFAASFKDWDPPSDQWVQMWRRPTFRINTAHTYRMAVQLGHAYRRTVNSLLSGPVTHTGIQFVGSFQTTSADPLAANPANNTNANGMDVLFQAD